MYHDISLINRICYFRIIRNPICIYTSVDDPDLWEVTIKEFFYFFPPASFPEYHGCFWNKCFKNMEQSGGMSNITDVHILPAGDKQNSWICFFSCSKNQFRKQCAR